MSDLGNNVQLIPEGSVVPAAGLNGTAINPQNKATLRAVLDVAAVSGTTPSAVVTIQTSYDNGDTDAWRSIGAFSAVTAVTGATPVRKSFPGCDRFVRAVVTVTGTTPTVTLGVSGEMV